MTANFDERIRRSHTAIVSVRAAGWDAATWKRRLADLMSATLPPVLDTDDPCGHVPVAPCQACRGCRWRVWNDAYNGGGEEGGQ